MKPLAMFAATILMMTHTAHGQSSQFLTDFRSGLVVPVGTNFELEYEIKVPRNCFTADTSLPLPVILVFDKHNVFGYDYIVSSLDYLMNLGNAPAAAVIGLGFGPENRLPLTLAERDGGKMEAFIRFLADWVPTTLEGKRRTGSVLLIGHSRTATLAIQALVQAPEAFHGALAASPGGFTAADREQWLQFVAHLNRLQAPRFLALTSGDEAHFEDEITFRNLTTFMDAHPAATLQLRCQVYPVDHLLSRTIDLLIRLNQYFEPYHTVVSQALALYDSGLFAFDPTFSLARQAAEQSGLTVQVDEVFLHSAFGKVIQEYDQGFFGAEKLRDFLDFVDGYLQHYPLDPFAPDMAAEVWRRLGDNGRAAEAARAALQSAPHYLWESEAERSEFEAYLKDEYLSTKEP